MTLFILIGGMVIKCMLDSNPLQSSCAISDFKMFGTLASAGVLELVFEFRGLVAIFQRNNKKDK